MSEKRNPRWVYVRDSEQEEWSRGYSIDRTRKDGYECVCATWRKGLYDRRPKFTRYVGDT